MIKVKDVLAKKGTDVATISPGKLVIDAANLMNERRIGSIVVMDVDQVVGIFTERDILTRVVGEGKDPTGTRVHEVMTTTVISCDREATVEQCGAFMTEKRIRHLPVVEEDRLAGIITIGDVMACKIAEKEETITHLQEYIFGPSLGG